MFDFFLEMEHCHTSCANRFSSFIYGSDPDLWWLGNMILNRDLMNLPCD